MSSHLRLLAAGAIFGLGVAVGLLMKSQGRRTKVPEVTEWPVNATRVIDLKEALVMAEDLLSKAPQIKGRTIGALWRARENDRDFVYVDIWPPYTGQESAIGYTKRMAVRVNAEGVAQWTWVEGTVLVERRSSETMRDDSAETEESASGR